MSVLFFTQACLCSRQRSARLCRCECFWGSNVEWGGGEDLKNCVYLWKNPGYAPGRAPLSSPPLPPSLASLHLTCFTHQVFPVFHSNKPVPVKLGINLLLCISQQLLFELLSCFLSNVWSAAILYEDVIEIFLPTFVKHNLYCITRKLLLLLIK